ncbi:MAG: glycosyltransferase family 4 protein [Erysipelothrix sp.]|nr:glycosyltransferase family 4 protein [Erysipelothrix sp.]
MRIGIFTETFTPDINGVVTSVVSLKKALEAHGHEVYVVTNHANIIKTVYDEENRILRLPGIKLDFLYGYKISSPIQLQANKTIKDWNLDVIHIQQEFGIGTYGRFLASHWEIPLLNTYHTTYEDYTHYVNILDSSLVEKFSKKVVEIYSKSFTKRSNIIISPSEKTKEMLEGYGINKLIKVIPTGLDLENFNVANTSEAEKEEIISKYNINPDDTIFTYVGRIAKEKSIDEVIIAFSEIKEKALKAKLLIVGGGPDLDDLKKLASKLDLNDYVFFEGQVDSSEVAKYYHTAHAFISASTTETQGLTYIEALASGLAVFAKEDDVLNQIVIEGETGYFFADSSELASKIETFIKHPEVKEEIYQNALAMSKKYSLEEYYNKIIETYKEAIEIEENEKNYFD